MPLLKNALFSLHINYYFILKFCKKTKNLWAYSNMNIALFLPDLYLFFLGDSSPRALHSPALIRTEWPWACCTAAVPEGASFITLDRIMPGSSPTLHCLLPRSHIFGCLSFITQFTIAYLPVASSLLCSFITVSFVLDIF